MQEKIITDKTFTLAKAKGFDIEVCRCGGFPECVCHEESPTQSLLQKWLREKHSVFVEIKTDTSVNEILGFEVRLKSWKFPPIYLDFFKDYEEALEAGLYESLKQAIESPK